MTTDRLHRVMKERCISNADWITELSRLDARGDIAHTDGRKLKPILPERLKSAINDLLAFFCLLILLALLVLMAAAVQE